jgi:uncharacterized protein
MRSLTRRLLAALAAVAMLAAVAFVQPPAAALAADAPVVISQVYGGGQSGGATFTHDFIELFNRSAASASLSNVSVQYGSASGNFTLKTVLPTVTLAPGQYFLISQGFGTAGDPLPVTPDLSGGISMSATAGKVALVQGTAELNCGGTTACSAATEARILDLVGYGTSTTFYEGSSAVPTLSAITAALRAGGGCTDTNQNGADFTIETPAPRNTTTTPAPCGSSTVDPVTKDDCKDEGWMQHGFRNQGLCIQYVNTGKDSR